MIRVLLASTMVCERFGACCTLHLSNWLLPCKLEVGVEVGRDAPHLQSILRILRVDLISPDIFMNLHIYTALQGGLVLCYPLFPVAAL